MYLLIPSFLSVTDLFVCLFFCFVLFFFLFCFFFVFFFVFRYSRYIRPISLFPFVLIESFLLQVSA